MQKKSILGALSLFLCTVLCFTSVTVTASANETQADEVNGAAAIMATASSQVGYYEGSGGYSKYGDYFGSPYIAWCGAFVSWCARTTGIPESVIPTNLSSTAMRNFFQGKGLYHLATSWGGNYIPKCGDIVFFTSTDTYNRSTNNITHVGLVLKATSSTVTCIEGNCPDRVRQIDRKYTSYIVGFATPEYDGIELVTPEIENVYKAGTYVTEEIMNFRTTPGGSIITTLPKDTTVQVTAVEGVWGKTVYNGQTGWLSLQYSIYKPASESGTENESTNESVTVTENQYRVTEKMNIRSTCDTSGSILGSVPAGTLLQVTEVANGNWGKISYNGINGWISLDWSVEFNPEVDWLVIDISQWQAESDIDWTQLKSDGVKGAIIRIGGRFSDSKTLYKDSDFLKHYKAAKNAGMYVGAYFFSYALTKEQAVEEAQYTLDILEKNNCVLDLPIYIDMEDISGDTQHISAGKTVCSTVLDKFCKTIENAGYYAGIYCSQSFAEDFVEASVFEGRSTWIADWNKNVCCYNGNVDVWQYTENGRLNGAKCDLDLNRMYVDYPALINAQNLENGLLVKGDVTMDGSVTAADARLTLRCAVNLETVSDIQSKLADMDGDGKITSADARDVLRLSIQ